MHTKIEIKEEDPLSEDVDSQNDTEFFTSNVTIKTESNVLLDNDCDMTIKMEIKSEAPLPDFQLKKIDIGEETLVPDFNSQEDSGFLQENRVTKVEKYNSDDEVDNKSEIKRDYCWLETETSSIYDEIKEDDLSAVKFPRSCLEAVSGDGGKSSLCSAEDLREDVSMYMVKDGSAHGHSIRSEVQGSNAMVNHSVEKNILSKQSVNHNNRGKSYMRASYLNEKNVTYETKGSHKCEVCEKRFTHLSSLRRHNLIHEGTKPHKCEICEKRFTQLAHLKNHKLIHEDKKPHKCAVCEKRFTELSNLKRHNLIHEGKKPHKCEACEKRFTRLSHLINHKLIHDDKKPHKCAICDKRFTEVSNLKKHSVTHEAIKPHKCEVCEKRFTRLSRLIHHKLIHDDKKTHKSAFCENKFT